MTTEIKFNNQYVLSRIEENKLIKNPKEGKNKNLGHNSGGIPVNGG